ncbi:MAG: hypothetical protein U0931_22700 [Vulcanimicrobiota bacterium]
MIYDSPPFLLALAVGLLLAFLAGRRLSRQMLGIPNLEGVLLVWAGLFLALSLQQAVQTFRLRVDLVHQEADSIAHVYRILSSLPQSQRTQMRLLLIAYLDAKLGDGKPQEVIGLQDQQFKLCCELLAGKTISEAQGLALRESIDRMISLHYRSTYALDEHLPGPLLALLISLCLAGSLLLGLGGRHPALAFTFILLMLMMMSALVDLDDAARGWVRVDRANLRDLVTVLHQLEQL